VNLVSQDDMSVVGGATIEPRIRINRPDVEDIVTRPDLADRAVFLTLEPIPEECRRPEAELWAAFEAERPRILGALLDAVGSSGCQRRG
jgi:hypothetical protein